MVAALGVVGAAVYALRLFIAAMHNRTPGSVISREIGVREAVAVVPLVLVILVLAFYPQFGLRRSEPSVKATVIPSELFAEGFNPTVMAGGGIAYFTYATGSGHHPTDLP
jgi:NADH:ubiquinone oxidoreductase subunit 4 (subunit M)